MLYISKLVLVINPKSISDEELPIVIGKIENLIGNHTRVVLWLEKACSKTAELIANKLQSGTMGIEADWPKEEDNDIRASKLATPEIFRAEVAFEVIIILTEKAEPGFLLERYRENSKRYPIFKNSVWVAELRTPKIQANPPKENHLSKLFRRL